MIQRSSGACRDGDVEAAVLRTRNGDCMQRAFDRLRSMQWDDSVHALREVEAALRGTHTLDRQQVPGLVVR